MAPRRPPGCGQFRGRLRLTSRLTGIVAQLQGIASLQMAAKTDVQTVPVDP